MICLACAGRYHRQCIGCDCCTDPITRVRAAVDELIAACHAAYATEVYAARRPVLAEVASWCDADEPAELESPAVVDGPWEVPL